MRRILVVSNDLVVYATAISQPTGIQRVAQGIAAGLLRIAVASQGQLAVELITVGGGAARRIEPRSVGIGGPPRVSARAAGPLLTLLSRAPRNMQERTRAVARSLLAWRAAREGRALRVDPTDWILVAGAPWIAPGTADAAVALKRVSGARLSLLVHDLLPLTSPEWYADRQSRSARDDVAALIGAADQLFAVSPEVAKEISLRLQRAARSLPPADPELQLPSSAESTKGADPYVLYVGTLHPRKRVASLARSIATIAAATDVATAPRLIIAGRRHPQDAELFAALAETERIPGLRERITLLHEVDDAALAQLYAGCRFVVLPSLAEGWGIPVREALAAGRPAIATDAVPAAIGSPFVCVIPAGDDRALTAAIQTWWNGDEPERLAARIRAEFTPRGWGDVAHELIDALDSAL